MIPIVTRSQPTRRLDRPRINIVAIADSARVARDRCVLGGRAAGNPIPLVVMAIVGVVLMQAPRIAQQWERAVVLRLGRFVGLRGPGPVLDRAVRRHASRRGSISGRSPPASPPSRR